MFDMIILFPPPRFYKIEFEEEICFEICLGGLIFWVGGGFFWGGYFLGRGIFLGGGPLPHFFLHESSS